MLDYRINTFLILCDELNYRVTAEKTNMTQPAVTNHIQALEAIYGVKLFDYASRTLTKTNECVMIEKFARRIKHTENELFAAIQKKKGMHIKLGATKTIGSFVVAPHIAKASKFNNVTISLDVDNTHNLLHKLDCSEIDIALIEGHFDKNNYAYRLYKSEKLVGICAAECTLANACVNLDELKRHNIILRENGSGSRDIFESALKTHNFSLSDFSSTITANDIGAITSLVKSGVGISFVYESVAKNDAADIAAFSLENVELYGEFNFVYLKDTDSEKLIRYLK